MKRDFFTFLLILAKQRER